MPGSLSSGRYKLARDESYALERNINRMGNERFVDASASTEFCFGYWRHLKAQRTLLRTDFFLFKLPLEKCIHFPQKTHLATNFKLHQLKSHLVLLEP